jgi:hypothetical protein
MYVVYVLVEASGEWEESSHRNLNASFDKELLQKLKKAHEDKIAQFKALYKKYTDMSDDWHRCYPTPNRKPYTKLKVPDWYKIKKKDVTPEMRAEKERIVELNRKNELESTADLDHHNAAWLTMHEKIQTDLGFNIMDYLSVSDVKYSIEEVPFLSLTQA